MNRAHPVIVGACSWLAGHAGAWIIALALVWMSSAPGPAWGQSAVWQPLGATSGNIYYNGGNVGIGAQNPAALLHLFGNSGYPKITVEGGPAAGFPLLQLMDDRTGGTNWNFENGREGLGILGIHSLVAGTAVAITQNGNVGIGTLNPGNHKLAVAGTISAEEVLVTSTGADYVFRPGYRLRPLSEVAAYIQMHRHLPEIPSEAEVKDKGVSLGDMQTKLLAKIEELTLHMIQAEKENQELRERIARLEAQAAH